MTVITLDPSGEIYGLPTYPWRAAPAGYATRRQLGALGLRPNGQTPAAQCVRPRRGRAGRVRGPLTAYLYRVELAAPKRPCTPAMLAAVRIAVRARMACVGGCGKSLDYIPPLSTGRRCFDCVSVTNSAPKFTPETGPVMREDKCAPAAPDSVGRP
jgi:hypothetical protein